MLDEIGELILKLALVIVIAIAAGASGLILLALWKAFFLLWRM